MSEKSAKEKKGVDKQSVITRLRKFIGGVLPDEIKKDELNAEATSGTGTHTQGRTLETRATMSTGTVCPY